MKSRLQHYVENIVTHTECSEKEKEDLYEELMTHLELARDEFINEGLTLKEAEEKAMELFGAEGEIGSQLQQAIFPFRKEMLLTLALSSILFTISAYLASLFLEGNANIGWLGISMILGGFLLFLPLNQHYHLNKKLWLNSLLILQILNLLYGLLIVSSLPNNSNVGLTIWVWLNIALAIILVYRTTVYDYRERYYKIIHGINIVSGMIIIGGTLFFGLSVMIMAGSIPPKLYIFLIPFAIWLVLYVVQMELARKYRKVAYFMSSLPFIMIMFIFLWMTS